MKILIWTQYFWPEVFRINSVASKLVELGHDVTVLTGKPNYPEGKYFGNGIEIIRLPLINRGRSITSLVLNYFSFVISGYFYAPKIFSEHKFDIVFGYLPSPIFQILPVIKIAKSRAIPLANWIQDLWPDVLVSNARIENRFIIRLVKKLVTHIYNSSDLLLLQSNGFRQSVCKLTQDHSKIEYLPNPAEYMHKNLILSDDTKQLMNELDAYFSVTFTGNLGIAQALDTVLDAAEYLLTYPEIRIFLVGSGSRYAWLSQEISARSLTNIVLTGKYPVADMQAIMASSSVLLASLSKGEVGENTIPSKLQSYLAAGKPIIACMDGEGAKIIKDANAGVTCPSEDPKALAAAICLLYSKNQSERDEYSENAKQYHLQNFDLELLCNKLIGHFKDLSESIRR